MARRQVPMIEVDGLQLVQQGPILRYLAKQTGFWPTGGAAEEHLVDHIMEVCLRLWPCALRLTASSLCLAVCRCLRMRSAPSACAWASAVLIL